MCQINLVQCINHKSETMIMRDVHMKKVGLSFRLNIWWKSRILIAFTQGVILQCVAVKLLLRVYSKKIKMQKFCNFRFKSNLVSFWGQNKLESCPDWSTLGLQIFWWASLFIFPSLLRSGHYYKPMSILCKCIFSLFLLFFQVID